MCFKINWASLINGRKFTTFALFYFVFEGNFKVQVPGGLYLEGQFNGGFFRVTSLGSLYLEGLINGGTYFQSFTVHVSNVAFLLPTVPHQQCNTEERIGKGDFSQ